MTIIIMEDTKILYIIIALTGNAQVTLIKNISNLTRKNTFNKSS